MAMMPAAPARLSITICCPMDSFRRVPTMRLSVSTALPGAFGTSMRIGRLG
jgi:hypothetical protein